MTRFTLIVLDFETVSQADLKEVGDLVYAQHWSTEVLTLVYRNIITKETWTWHPGDDQTRLHYLASDPDCIFIAHQCGFEKSIWREIMVSQFGFPDIPNPRWHDTMAACAMKVIPLKLERALPALGLPMEKDMDGNRLVIGMNRAYRKDGDFDRSQATTARVDTYCEGDVDAQSALHSRLGFLPPGERKVWLLDQTINERGIKLDQGLIEDMQFVAKTAIDPLIKQFREITGFNPTQRDKVMGWLLEQGAAIPDLKKDTIDAILGDDDEEESLAENDSEAPLKEARDQLPPHVHTALKIRRLAGSASIKKLSRMLGCIARDGRAHRLLQYHGAGTGRWSGRLLQPQNFPKGTLEFDKRPADPGLVAGILRTRDPAFIEAMLGMHPINVIISSLRYAIMAAPGRELMVGDFAQIEARIVLALAGQSDKVALLARGEDPYISMATQIFKRPITKADTWERGIGKNSVLGLGFQMGDKTFQRRYASERPLSFCSEVVETYRTDWAPKVPELWKALDRASLAAAQTRRPHEAYGVEYAIEEQWMTARLPSGRKLWYHKPELYNKTMPWSTPEKQDIRETVRYWVTKQGKYMSQDMYGGILTENVVQALARDIMTHSMFLAEVNGFPIILTVHDEIIAEPEKQNADMKAFQQIMESPPAWARAMMVPIKAECWQGERYRK